MRFSYQYRTADNILKSGMLSASSKDAAYSELKARGIRPSRVVEVSGFWGRLFGKGKRWIAIVVLAMATVSATIFALTRGSDVLQSIPRQQIVGDVVVIADGARCGWTNVLSSVGDRLLAAYAQPGVSVRFDAGMSNDDLARELEKCAGSRLAVSRADRAEHRQVKQIVNAMRTELSEYLQAGGSASGYMRQLHKRLKQEQLIAEQLNQRFRVSSRGREPEKIYQLWSDANLELSHLGLQTIPLPEELLQ